MKKPMTANELREAVYTLDLKQRELAADLGVTVTSVNNWVCGRQGVPHCVAAYMRLRLRVRELERAVERLQQNSTGQPAAINHRRPCAPEAGCRRQMAGWLATIASRASAGD
jgi:transcriptional regulator with XRE-family HTH domain